MTTSISVDQPVRDPARARLANQAAQSQRNTEQQTVLLSIEVVQPLRDARGRQHKDDGAVRVRRHVIHARHHHGHVPEHLEVVQEIGRAELAVDDLAVESKALPVAAVLERAELGSREERLGEEHQEAAQDDAEHDGVPLEDPAPSLVLGDEATGDGAKVWLSSS